MCGKCKQLVRETQEMCRVGQSSATMRKYHYNPLAFSSKTITKILFVVCFGHFSNRI